MKIIPKNIKAFKFKVDITLGGPISSRVIHTELTSIGYDEQDAYNTLRESLQVKQVSRSKDSEFKKLPVQLLVSEI